jgi:hypothetical protein
MEMNEWMKTVNILKLLQKGMTMVNGIARIQSKLVKLFRIFHLHEVLPFPFGEIVGYFD